MKHIFCLISLAILGITCYAQPPQPDKNDAIAKKIQNEKIAYFTRELDLTSEEAQAFWPLYNEYKKEADAAHDATMKALWEASKINSKDNVTDAEIDKILTTYNKALKDEASLAEKYYAKYTKILPASKIAKLYFAEESFKRVILNKFRNPAVPKTPATGLGRQTFGFGYKSPVK